MLYCWINPVFIESAENVLAVELIVRLLADMEKEFSDNFPLDVGEQSEVAGVITGLCKAEGHSTGVSTLQIRNEVGW